MWEIPDPPMSGKSLNCGWGEAVGIVTYQRSFGIWKKLAKLSQQIFLASEQIGDLREDFILRHATVRFPLGILHNQLLLLARERGGGG